VLTPDEAKTRGFEIAPPACASRAPHPALGEPGAGASPAPRGTARRRFINYALRRILRRSGPDLGMAWKRETT